MIQIREIKNIKPDWQNIRLEIPEDWVGLEILPAGLINLITQYLK
jgi:hypothetical protein